MWRWRWKLKECIYKSRNKCQRLQERGEWHGIHSFLEPPRHLDFPFLYSRPVRHYIFVSGHFFVVICCGHLGNECTMPHVCMGNFSRDQYLVFVQTKQQENLIWSVVVCKAVLWIFLSSNSKQDMYKHSLPLFNILFRLTGRFVEKDRTQNTLKCL